MALWLDQTWSGVRRLQQWTVPSYRRAPDPMSCPGKLLHIDFGDCFEASMHREKFPERVPFRLTRMMIKAFEVSGIEGNFRYCCLCSRAFGMWVLCTLGIALVLFIS